MSNLIKEENIVIRERVSDWKEAIILATQPLIDGGYVEERYLDAIFKSTEKFGPYYVLAPNIAMPHAGAGDGVIEKQISLLVIKEPIKFSENGYDVRLVFVLATPDNHSHLQTLRELSELFSDETMLETLMNETVPSNIVKLLNNTLMKGD